MDFQSVSSTSRRRASSSLTLTRGILRTPNRGTDGSWERPENEAGIWRRSSAASSLIFGPGPKAGQAAFTLLEHMPAILGLLLARPCSRESSLSVRVALSA